MHPLTPPLLSQHGRVRMEAGPGPFLLLCAARPFFLKKKLFITPPYQDQSLSSLQAAVVDSINVPLFLARPFSICNILVQWEKVVRRYTPSVSC